LGVTFFNQLPAFLISPMTQGDSSFLRPSDCDISLPYL
jgi:hypothetical protein